MKPPPLREDYGDIRAFIRDWEHYWDQAKPKPAAILRRAAMVANDAAQASRYNLDASATAIAARTPTPFGPFSSTSSS